MRHAPPSPHHRAQPQSQWGGDAAYRTAARGWCPPGSRPAPSPNPRPGCRRRRLEADRPLLLIRPKPLRPTRHAITMVSTIDGGHYPALSARGRAVRPDAYTGTTPSACTAPSATCPRPRPSCATLIHPRPSVWSPEPLSETPSGKPRAIQDCSIRRLTLVMVPRAVGCVPLLPREPHRRQGSSSRRPPRC